MHSESELQELGIIGSEIVPKDIFIQRPWRVGGGGRMLKYWKVVKDFPGQSFKKFNSAILSKKYIFNSK